MLRSVGHEPKWKCRLHDQCCHWTRGSDWEYETEGRDWNEVGLEHDKYRYNDKSRKDIWEYGKRLE
jgi:hypothetical protein